MTDRKHRRADPSTDQQSPAEQADVESLNRANPRQGGVTADEAGEPGRDPADADSAESVSREGHINVEGL